MRQSFEFAIARCLNGIFPPACLKLIALGLLCVATMTGAKLSKDLQHVAPDSVVDVIIQFPTPPSDSDIAAVARSGGAFKKAFKNIPSALVTARGASLQGI